MSIAASVLDCFAVHAELGATQVARELGVAKSTACRMLSALAAGGLLDRAGGGRYRLSMRVFELGVLAAERMPVRDAARPVLIELQQQLREMVQLGVPVAGHVAYIDRYGHAALGLQLSGEVLHRVPGYSSSSGRALAGLGALWRPSRWPGRRPVFSACVGTSSWRACAGPPGGWARWSPRHRRTRSCSAAANAS